MKQEFFLCWFKLIPSSHTVVKVFLMIYHSFPTKIFFLNAICSSIIPVFGFRLVLFHCLFIFIYFFFLTLKY